MPTQPIISFVLGTYNRKTFLKKTLASIRTCGITLPYEILVVDRGSTDGTISYLVRQPDVTLILYHSKEPKPWGYSMNLAFRPARGKYILMLSDDTLLIPGSVQNGYSMFEQKLAAGENIGALAFYFRNYPGDQEYFIAKTLGDIPYVNHGMYLRKALEQINFIDEDHYFFYHGDADVCLRLKEMGYLIQACDKAFVEHFKHVGTSNRNAYKDKHDASWEYFRKRWGHLTNYPTLLTEKNVNKKKYLPYKDTHDTARAFRRTYAYWRYQAYRRLLAIKKKLFSK